MAERYGVYLSVRHPSESWGIPLGGRGGIMGEIPAFAGMTGFGRRSLYSKHATPAKAGAQLERLQ